jgi:predicted ABC-type exoprotein transport system permease subunit
MDGKTTVEMIAIGVILFLVTAIRYSFRYKKKRLSSGSSRFIAGILICAFVLYVVANLISFYYHIPLLISY